MNLIVDMHICIFFIFEYLFSGSKFGIYSVLIRNAKSKPTKN